MIDKEIKEIFQKLSIWKNGNQRAPHKPLLLLYALGKVYGKNDRMMAYEQVMSDLGKLLAEFGPPRNRYNTNYPFIRLANDGIWELKGNQKLDTSRDYSNRQLIDLDAFGGFNEKIYLKLISDKALIRELAELLLENHFPSSLHEDILHAIGLDFEMISRRRRDPDFRDRILRAYE